MTENFDPPGATESGLPPSAEGALPGGALPPPSLWANGRPAAEARQRTQFAAPIGASEAPSQPTKGAMGTMSWLALSAGVAVLGGLLLKAGEQTTFTEFGLEEKDYNATGKVGMSLMCVAIATFFGRGTFRSLGRIIRGEGGLGDALFAGSNVKFALITLAALAGAVLCLGLAVTG